MSEKIVNFIVGIFGSLATVPFIKEIIVFDGMMLILVDLKSCFFF